MLNGVSFVMQCIILAAGKGARMQPLTFERPKPLVLVAGIPLLEHILQVLPDAVDELIIVVGYKGDMIVSHFGDEAYGRPVRYVWQHEVGGPGAALTLARDILHGKFMVLYADDLVDKDSLERAAAHDLSMLAIEHSEPHRFGVILLNEDGTVADILEKPDVPPTNLVSTSGMVLDERVFDHIGPREGYKEIFLSHAVADLARCAPVHIVRMSFWCPVGRPEDIPIAETLLLSGAHLSTPSTLTRA